MNVLFTFPGQGSQFPQMLHALPQDDLTQDFLQHAAQILGEPWQTLDSTTALASTRAVQLCLLLTGVIQAQRLIQQGIQPDVLSGFSIGAFAAAVISGALEFDDAVQVVALRGELMQQAYPSGFGLTALVGLDQWQVSQLVAEIHTPDQPVYLANVNNERQMVIAGSEIAMQAVAKCALQRGASNIHRLNVSVPSHCALLNQASQQLSLALQSCRWHSPRIAYLSGSSARICRDPQSLAQDLAHNMSQPVHWHQAVSVALERGVQLMVEMPPGNVLTELSRPSMPFSVQAVSLSQTPFETVQALYQRCREKE